MTRTRLRLQRWIGGVALVGIGALIGWQGLDQGGREASSPGRGLVTERLEGLRTTVRAGEGPVVHIAARSVESPPMRLLGPVRLGFLRAAVASDVRIDVDARQGASPPRGEAPSARLSMRTLGLSHGTLAGLEINGLEFRIVDPLGRALGVHARRCEMDSPTTVRCFHGVMDYGARQFPFARARFDGASWEILESPTGEEGRAAGRFGTQAVSLNSFGERRCSPPLQCPAAVR